MLAAMTSLALAAHATRAATPPFNANFYIVVATVIPVLFVAIAVQGRVLETLASAATSAAHDYQRALRSRARLKAIAAQARALLPIATASLVVIDGAFGEIIAIVALQNQRGGTETFVATAVVLLTFAAAAGPALTCGKTVLKVMDLLNGESSSTAAAVTGTPSGPPSETGKTGAA